MVILKKENVLEAALDRIRMLFDEFDEVVVSFSGGKDSTVCLELALQVASEKNRLPLKVLWIDQEAEWQATVDYVTEVMERDDVDPMWYQIPMRMTNNASSYQQFANVWEEGREWLHPKHPLSKKENVYGADRFHDLFSAITAKEFAGQKVCHIGGVRTEEAPKRKVALTHGLTYKWITWGTRLSKKEEHYTFYPIYDWSYTDVWKYIHDNDLSYNRIYDEYYRHGIAPKNMRVSNLHHETAIQSLLIVQELEPDLWNRLEAHIAGANSIKHLQKASFTCPKELPYMFESWEQYGLHLANNIIQDETKRDALLKRIERNRKYYKHSEKIQPDFWKAIINTILSSDWDFTKLTNFEMSPAAYAYKKWVRDGVFPVKYPQYLSAQEIHEYAKQQSEKADSTT